MTCVGTPASAARQAVRAADKVLPSPVSSSTNRPHKSFQAASTCGGCANNPTLRRAPSRTTAIARAPASGSQRMKAGAAASRAAARRLRSSQPSRLRACFSTERTTPPRPRPRSAAGRRSDDSMPAVQRSNAVSVKAARSGYTRAASGKYAGGQSKNPVVLLMRALGVEECQEQSPHAPPDPIRERLRGMLETHARPAADEAVRKLLRQGELVLEVRYQGLAPGLVPRIGGHGPAALAAQRGARQLVHGGRNRSNHARAPSRPRVER